MDTVMSLTDRLSLPQLEQVDWILAGSVQSTQLF